MSEGIGRDDRLILDNDMIVNDKIGIVISQFITPTDHLVLNRALDSFIV